MNKEITQPTNLFEKVVKILEEARTNVIRSINNNMVIAYWLIGKEIVDEIQSGKERAEYGKKVIVDLSNSLQAKFGRGYSATNLRYFRNFYNVYKNRIPEIHHIRSGESSQKQHKGSGVLEDMHFSVTEATALKGFSPNLSWSHYCF